MFELVNYLSMQVSVRIHTIFHLSKVASVPPAVITYISSNRNRIATTAFDADFSSTNSALAVVHGY